MQATNKPSNCSASRHKYGAAKSPARSFNGGTISTQVCIHCGQLKESFSGSVNAAGWVQYKSA